MSEAMSTVAEASERYVSLHRAAKTGHAASKRIVDEANSFQSFPERMIYLNELRLNLDLILHDVNEMRRNPAQSE